MNILTHTVSDDLVTCSRCRQYIPPFAKDLVDSLIPPNPGEKVGVIPSRIVPATSYRIGDNDSNQECC